MLLSKQITPGDIATFKLVTNDEIIAKVISVDFDSVVITKPMYITVGIDERTNAPGVQMSPYFLLCADHDTNITIKNMHIVTSTLASNNAKSGYIRNTTGLITEINSSNKSNGSLL
jgi:hypothetical protein